MKTKNKLILIKSSKYDNYLDINKVNRTLEFNDYDSSTLFYLKILSTNKIVLQSQDGYYARTCHDDTIKADTLDINKASVFNVSFANKKEMYIKSNYKFLYVDSDFTLRCDNYSRSYESLFKIQEYANKSREPFVSIYSDANYKGNAQPLVPGYYDINQLTIGNDTLSSIKVPNGLVAILYSDANFKGNSITVTKDTPYIGDYFNDKVSSIIIEKAPNNNVVIYSDSNYQGKSQVLSLGYHDINQLIIGNDALSSIKVPNGFIAILYSDANFKGNSITITSDTPYIGDYFNDKVSSIFVEKAPNNNVVIYSDSNYQGKSQVLSPGYYNIDQLTIGNDTLSSIKVANGFIAVLYSDDNFKGNAITVTKDIPYIGDYFNDKVSSIIVKAIK